MINSYQAYDTTSNSCLATATKEFYQINENVPVPKLDTAGADLLATGSKLNRQQQKNYNALTAQLTKLLASQPGCPGDINLDGIVNYLDVADWEMLQVLSLGNSSWGDVNLDGLTDSADLAIILQNFGSCPTWQRAQALAAQRVIEKLRIELRPRMTVIVCNVLDVFSYQSLRSHSAKGHPGIRIIDFNHSPHFSAAEWRIIRAQHRGLQRNDQIDVFCVICN